MRACLNGFFRNKGELWNYAFVLVLKIGEMYCVIPNCELRITRNKSKHDIMISLFHEFVN